METNDFQLIEAAEKGDVNRVKELIERGVPIDVMKVRFIVFSSYYNKLKRSLRVQTNAY